MERKDLPSLPQIDRKLERSLKEYRHVSPIAKVRLSSRLADTRMRMSLRKAMDGQKDIEGMEQALNSSWRLPAWQRDGVEKNIKIKISRRRASHHLNSLLLNKVD